MALFRCECGRVVGGGRHGGGRLPAHHRKGNTYPDRPWCMARKGRPLSEDEMKRLKSARRSDWLNA